MKLRIVLLAMALALQPPHLEAQSPGTAVRTALRSLIGQWCWDSLRVVAVSLQPFPDVRFLRGTCADEHGFLSFTAFSLLTLSVVSGLLLWMALSPQTRPHASAHDRFPVVFLAVAALALLGQLTWTMSRGSLRSHQEDRRCADVPGLLPPSSFGDRRLLDWCVPVEMIADRFRPAMHNTDHERAT